MSQAVLTQVDSALLSHPLVTEAVSFGAPDEKYGESVAAAVVLSKPVDDEEATVAEIKKAAASKLAKYKVCVLPITPQKDEAFADCHRRARHALLGITCSGGRIIWYMVDVFELLYHQVLTLLCLWVIVTDLCAYTI